MADTFRMYKGGEQVVEGPSPLAITGVGPEVSVTAGEYQATRVQGKYESAKVDIPAFTTTAPTVAVPKIGTVTPTADGATVELT